MKVNVNENEYNNDNNNKKKEGDIEGVEGKSKDELKEGKQEANKERRKGIES